MGDGVAFSCTSSTGAQPIGEEMPYASLWTTSDGWEVELCFATLDGSLSLRSIELI